MSIVLAYDESPGSRAAPAMAVSLAARFDEPLVLVYGVEPPGGVGEEFEAHQRAVAELGRATGSHALGVAHAAAPLRPPRPVRTRGVIAGPSGGGSDDGSRRRRGLG